jgi:hypothetical protein
MNTEFTEYILKCDRCGAIKKGKTQNIELAKKITIDHKKCGGKFRFLSEGPTTIEPEPTESKPAPKLESKEVDSPTTSGTTEINLAPIRKIEAIFQCNKCPALIKISGENIEKAEKLTFPHNQCQNPEKGAFRFLTVVGRVVDSSGQYSNEKIRKIKKFVCNNCPYNPIGKWYKHVDPCPKPYNIFGVCYLENIEFRYLRSGDLTTQSTLQILDDVKDIIITIGEDKKQVSLNDIKRLFINRFDRYSLQNPDAPEKFPDVKEPLTDHILLTGMLGGKTIGTRSVNPEDNKIKSICYDIDGVHNENPKLVVDTIVRCLREWYNLTGHVEKSGSPDSYHVWVFLEPTDNDIAYEFDKAFKARLKALLNSMGIETTPDSIDRGVQKGEGCMIKLPFNVQLKNNVRSEFLGDISKIQPEKLPV